MEGDFNFFFFFLSFSFFFFFLFFFFLLRNVMLCTVPVPAGSQITNNVNILPMVSIGKVRPRRSKESPSSSPLPPPPLQPPIHSQQF
ncbi:hypothetical protein L211DRAFT_493504 [Terfezia boudieri ATCC MYA-4762]|uniref:Uncharacterized protein n=1 Tax=Terfezia boudieri ATCC MYA-4762 TaxID=1051890 RepID=A0A3N4LH65_9PEZI|nr:hypothetical protein L211DRAFT_493504 [Terfezia boudieri ATCC MYA-4762]